jgi:hypothetical protein
MPDLALLQITGFDRSTRGVLGIGILRNIKPEFGFPSSGIKAMARETMFSQNRPDITIKLNVVSLAGGRPTSQRHHDNDSLHDEATGKVQGQELDVTTA